MSPSRNQITPSKFNKLKKTNESSGRGIRKSADVNEFQSFGHVAPGRIAHNRPLGRRRSNSEEWRAGLGRIFSLAQASVGE